MSRSLTLHHLGHDRLPLPTRPGPLGCMRLSDVNGWPHASFTGAGKRLAAVEGPGKNPLAWVDFMPDNEEGSQSQPSMSMILTQMA